MSENDIWKLLSTHHSRLLSQLDRDPDSPSFGSFDRNFWNYKIRDFSSIILQQGILYLDALYSYENLNNVFYKKEDVKNREIETINNVIGPILLIKFKRDDGILLLLFVSMCALEVGSFS